MKYLALLGALVVIALLLTRPGSVATVQQSVAEPDAVAAPSPVAASAATPTAGAALKQPIDRTKAVLQQVSARNGAGEF